MKILLTTTAAIAATLAVVAPAAAQRVPAANIAVVDTSRVTTECTACRAASAALQGQVTALRTRQQQLAASLQGEGTAIQTAVNALNGKQPDATLTARIKAVQAKEEAANQELQRGQQQIQRNQQYVLQQIGTKLTPVIQQVMDRRGANLVIDASASLKAAPALDVTNDVLAGLNAALPSVSTTAPAAAAPTRR
ncbi:MAG TPA: OmpH family outer membrane protein [Sphingomicrobium sp.]|nr:OmpH family outer membrane protein [Sphingomicrobium sp.]